MKSYRFATTGVVAMVACVALHAACHAEGGHGSEWTNDPSQTKDVNEANNRLTNAYLREDVALLREMLVDAHVHNNVFGVALTKKQFLRDIETGALEFESYKTTKIKWHIDGSTAVGTGVIKARARRDGRLVPATDFLFTRVFVKRKGQWKVLLFHNTMIPNAASPER